MSYKTYLGHTICRPETARIEQLHNAARFELFLLLPSSRMSTNTSLMYTSNGNCGYCESCRGKAASRPSKPHNGLTHYLMDSNEMVGALTKHWQRNGEHLQHSAPTTNQTTRIRDDKNYAGCN
jgi:hypothetical protein